MRRTSPRTSQYNCIAWAAGDTRRWWWPDRNFTSYWPLSIPREETIDAFIAVFNTLGYDRCEDASLEPNYEKIAIFCKHGNMPTHAARQLNSGLWTSKLGKEIDVEHDFDELSNFPELVREYGQIAFLMRRSN